MGEDTIPAVRNSLSTADLEDTKASSYASGTGLFFVIVIVALRETIWRALGSDANGCSNVSAARLFHSGQAHRAESKPVVIP